MSRTLKLSDRLLEMGRSYASMGRDREALRVLGKLATFGRLPNKTAEEAGSHLAEISLRVRNFPKARRHLAAALARRPQNAHFHHLLARSLMEDENSDLERALRHFHLAVRLDPKNAVYHGDYGQCLLDSGEIEEGLKHLREAQRLAPEDPKHLRELALALVDCGDGAEARRLALAALFRSPHDARVRRLWNDLRFQQAHLEQQSRGTRWCLAPTNEPVLLPFVRRPAARTLGRAIALRLRTSTPRRTPPRKRRQNP